MSRAAQQRTVGIHSQASPQLSKCASQFVGCSRVVESVCKRSYHPFERLMSCLLPRYASLAATLLHAEDSTSSTTCIAVEQTEGGIQSLLNALIGSASARHLRFVMTDRPCALSVLPANRTVSVSLAAPPNSTATWRALHRDVRRAVPLSWRPNAALPLYAVLITRTTNRRIRNDEAVLASRLSKETALSFRLYRGNESVLSTLRLFARASAIVGIHGAGHANAVFTVTPVCVIELSTYLFDQTWQKRCGLSVPPANATWIWNGTWVMPWRSSRGTIPPWNPKIAWHCYRVSLGQVLDANGWPCNAPPSPLEHRLKKMTWVQLGDHDVDNIAETIRGCRSSANRRYLRRRDDGMDDAERAADPARQLDLRLESALEAAVPSPPSSYVAVVSARYDGTLLRKTYESVELSSAA